MRTQRRCEHDASVWPECGGYLTTTEEEMHKMRPEHSVHFYHDILFLFERACMNMVYEL